MISPICLALVVASLPAAPLDAVPSNIVQLDDYAACGPVSLYLVTQLRGLPAEWKDVSEQVGPLRGDGTHSFADLARVAEHLGMFPVGLQVRRATLADMPMPAIVQLRDQDDPTATPHFAVLLEVRSDGVILLDAPYPAYFLPESEFERAWAGHVMVFAQDAREATRLRTAAQVSTLSWGVLRVLVLLAGVAVLGFLLRGRRFLVDVSTLVVVGRRRPLLAGLGCAVLLVLAAGLSWFRWSSPQGVKPAGSPSCVFDKPVVKLGELSGSEVTVPVKITNPGATPLHISAVRSTCSCAVVHAPDVIPPGESSEMKVELSVAPGPSSARLTVESNDPEGPKTVSLSWHGQAKPQLVPWLVAAFAAPADKPYERTISLVYPGGPSALRPILHRVECPSKRVEVRAGTNDPMATRLGQRGQLTQVKGELKLHLKVRHAGVPETVDTRCKLHLKYGSRMLTVELPIGVHFTGGELTPDVDGVAFSAGRALDLVGQERLVKVTARSKAAVVKVREVPSWLACEVIARSPNTCSLRLKITAVPGQQFESHTLYLSPADDSRGEVPLRVCVFASES